MSQRFKDFKNEEKETSGLDFEIPDTKNILAGLDEQIASREEVFVQHQDQMEEEKEDLKKGKRKKPRQKPKGGTICFCGNPQCNIGGFVEQQS